MRRESCSDSELFEHVYTGQSYEDLPVISQAVLWAIWNHPTSLQIVLNLFQNKGKHVLRLNYRGMDKAAVWTLLRGTSIINVDPYQLSANGIPLEYHGVMRDGETLGGVVEETIRDIPQSHLLYLIGVLSAAKTPSGLLCLAPPQEPIQKAEVVRHRHQLVWQGSI